MKKGLPALTDYFKCQLTNQFGRTPADTAFWGDEKKVFFVTQIHASGAWSMIVTTLNGGTETITGPASAVLIHPIAFGTLGTNSGITRLIGFWMTIKA